jgi:hypothetical protein
MRKFNAETAHRRFFLAALCSNGGDFFAAIDAADEFLERLTAAPAKLPNKKVRPAPRSLIGGRRHETD